MRLMVSAPTARMGGAFTHLWNILHAWRANADTHEIWVLVPPVHVEQLSALSLPDNIHLLTSTTTFGSPLNSLIWTNVKLPRVLRQLQADALISLHNFTPLVRLCPTVLLVSNALYFSQAYEREIRNVDYRFYWNMRLRRLLVKRSMRAADVVVTPTAALKADILKFSHLRPEQIEIAPWGVDHALYCPQTGECQPDVRKAHLLFVSHHAPHKNFSTLIEACGLLHLAGQFEFELTLTISEGENPPHSNRTVSLIRNLGLTDRIRLVGGQPQMATPGIYTDADLFVFPSYCESFGLPLVEAMASGLPIVAADTPSNREVCGPAAVYFPPFDAQALADRLGDVLESTDLRRSLVGMAVERGRSFSWDRTANRLFEIAVGVSASK